MLVCAALLCPAGSAKTTDNVKDGGQMISLYFTMEKKGVWIQSNASVWGRELGTKGVCLGLGQRPINDWRARRQMSDAPRCNCGDRDWPTAQNSRLDSSEWASRGRCKLPTKELALRRAVGFRIASRRVVADKGFESPHSPALRCGTVEVSPATPGCGLDSRAQPMPAGKS